MGMLDYVIESTTEYIAGMPKTQRKKYGQFFTSKETAAFMAELFTLPQGKNSISILDPGAGSGILSAALLDRLELESAIERIELVCYENDPQIIGLLTTNLEWICNHATKKVEYKIITDNYILSQALDYNGMQGANPNPAKFDMIIGNPPYMKIAKDASETLVMMDVCYGAPNLYFMFAAMSMFNLSDEGEMVYIIPRSWTSGAYFKRFRMKFLQEGALTHIHLFISRDKVFEQERVLQETIVIKAKKTFEKPKCIVVTTTQSNADFSRKTVFEAPYDTVVSGEACYVYLVTSAKEVQALNRLNRWKNTLPDIGLKMKTGLTVDFRMSTDLRDSAEEGAVPLFYAQHIQNGQVVFPIGKEHEYIVTKQNGLLQRNENYLFVKRFTAKEEHRRLQCGIYLAHQYPEYANISTQNKINFICGAKELSECAVYGLYVLFNSTLYDCYYRILDGSTQVNSTEINTMPVPPMGTIEVMGEELIHMGDMSEAVCDSILERYI